MKLLTPENFPRLETPVIVGLPPPFEMRACLLAALSAAQLLGTPSGSAPTPTEQLLYQQRLDHFNADDVRPTLAVS